MVSSVRYWVGRIVPCAALCVGTMGVAMAQAPEPIDYLDDRSSGVATIRSLYNAVNRQEYLRAFSYFSAAYQEPDAETLEEAYRVFTDGYAQTESVTLLLGEESEEGAAGSTYFTVPVAIEATNERGAVERFAGCYVLRLTQPAIQDVPPFRPLTIESGHLVPADGALEAILPDECPEG